MSSRSKLNYCRYNVESTKKLGTYMVSWLVSKCYQDEGVNEKLMSMEISSTNNHIWVLDDGQLELTFTGFNDSQFFLIFSVSFLLKRFKFFQWIFYRLLRGLMHYLLPCFQELTIDITLKCHKIQPFKKL